MNARRIVPPQTVNEIVKDSTRDRNGLLRMQVRRNAPFSASNVVLTLSLSLPLSLNLSTEPVH